MSPRPALAAESRDAYLALRRVERQQAIVERVHASRGSSLRLGGLADDFGVSVRTVARDVARLRQSGVPLVVTPGRGGGVRMDLPPGSHPGGRTVHLDPPEIAVLLASLAALGPSTGDSASSAAAKLAAALVADPG